MRRRARILRRSALVALCGLAVVSVFGWGASSSPAGRRAAGPTTTRSTVTGSTTAAPPATVATSTPRAVATAFAAAYARYLQGVLPADRLPACSRPARAMVVQSGPLPVRLGVRQLRLTAVVGAGGSWAAWFAILDGSGRGRGEVSAELVLTPTPTGWKVAEVVAPDLDTLLDPSTRAVRSTGPAAARRIALEFIDSYVAYIYGHAGIEALRDLTPKLDAMLGEQPPRVPQSIRRLDPRVASLALSPRATEWLAGANVTDGPNTYQVISVVARVRGRWLVVALGPGG